MALSQIPDSINQVRDRAAELSSTGHPNPLLSRAQWLDLDGTWQFSLDPQNRGLDARWQDAPQFEATVLVPYAPETLKSGFHNDPGQVFWYHRLFVVPEEWQGQRLILHFGAVDYGAMVFINGKRIGTHQGGYTPFEFDITSVINPATDNRLVVRVVDTREDLDQPRGKQTWQARPEGILYTPTSGIWQSVWLEPRPFYALASVTLTPNQASASVAVQAGFTGPLPADRDFHLSAVVLSEGTVVGTAETTVHGENGKLQVTINPSAADVVKAPVLLWSPDDPHLYSITIRLDGPDGPPDVVESYFGIRTLAVDAHGAMILNGSSLYLRMLLDQGYFPESGLTGTDRQFREDILLIKAMGFNGVRKHQKIEDPRFLYWCDRLGLLVWEEMPSAYVFHSTSMTRLVSEWLAVIRRDIGHPSIIAWVPFNESWGIAQLGSDPQQQAYAMALYYLTKALDPTRWVIANDGWEHVQTDLVTIHDYRQDPSEFATLYQTRESILALKPAQRSILVSPALASTNAPILLTECGGMTVANGFNEGWGYGTTSSFDELAATYQDLIGSIQQSPVLQGYCYTQFTDVEQEQNGLTTIERTPKIPITLIRRANLGEFPSPKSEADRVSDGPS